MTLAPGDRYELKVYWDNGESAGKLQVKYEDPLNDGSAVSSFAPSSSGANHSPKQTSWYVLPPQ